MKSLALALVAVLLLAAPAPAASAETQPAAPQPFTIIQPAIMKAGDTRRYQFEATTVRSNGGPSQTKVESYLVDLTVVSVSRSRLVMRYTLVSFVVGEPSVPLARAIQATPIEFEANATGLPLSLIGWPDRRQALIAALRRAGAELGMDVAGDLAFLEQLDETGAMATLIPEVRTVADMQSWPPMNGYRLDDPDWTRNTGENQSNLFSWRAIEGGANCVATLRRVTGLKPDSPVARSHGQREQLETTAKLSLFDGWVISAVERRERERDGSSETMTRTATLVSGPETFTCPKAKP